MSEGKILTHSQVFSRVLCVVLSPLVLVLFYLGNKYVCHCWSLKNSSLIGIVWPVWACTPLSLSVLSWKVPLFSLLEHPLRPVCGWSIIMSVGQGMACLSVASHTLLGGTRRVDLNGTLPSSFQTTVSPPPPASCSGSAGHYCFCHQHTHKHKEPGW